METLNNIPKNSNEISLEDATKIRYEIFEKSREFFPNSTFPGELDPKSSSLTIFNNKQEHTIASTVGVVQDSLERLGEIMIDRRDENNVDNFKKYLDSLI
jgi:hypothetical protein